MEVTSRWRHTWLEIIDILTCRLQMAQWQMESLSGKKNGNQGMRLLFSPPTDPLRLQPVTFHCLCVDSACTLWSITLPALFSRNVERSLWRFLDAPMLAVYTQNARWWSFYVWNSTHLLFSFFLCNYCVHGLTNQTCFVYLSDLLVWWLRVIKISSFEFLLVCYWYDLLWIWTFSPLC